MLQSIILDIEKDQHRKYVQTFSFFQSKPINMIIASRKLPYVIHFRDLEFMGDETEFFKRYYSSLETLTRLLKLINYYEMNMTPPIPNLIPTSSYPILENRYKKHLKLYLQKEKSLAEHSDNEERSYSTNDQFILSLLNLTNLSVDSSQKEEDSPHESFDSEPHYAFKTQKQAVQLYQSSRTLIQDQEIESIDLRVMNNGQLVIDFRGKIEEIASVQLPSQRKIVVQTASIGIQASNLQSGLRNKSESKKIRNEKQVDGGPPELKKQILWSPKHTQLRGSIMLTESIEIRKEQKKKQTFMQYYNSIPVKNPSNILQKYIKGKK